MIYTALQQTGAIIEHILHNDLGFILYKSGGVSNGREGIPKMDCRIL